MGNEMEAAGSTPGGGFTLAGKVALVTGGASGIGLATVRLLAASGARVVACDIRRELMEERLGEQLLADGQVVARELDITDVAAVERLLGELAEASPLDALVCAAGTNIPDRRLEQLTQESWRFLLETNLTGAFSLLSAALPQLRTTQGHVAVVASVSSLWPDVSGPAYQASKAGVLGLVRAAAVEEHEHGIRFTAVMPGMAATELLTKRPTPPSDDVLAKCLQPEDVAAAIVFALSLPPRACIAELTILPNQLQALGRT